MVPAGTKTIAFGPLYGPDGGHVTIEVLYKYDTSEFFGYHPELPWAFHLSTDQAKAIVLDPKTINFAKIICGDYKKYDLADFIDRPISEIIGQPH